MSEPLPMFPLNTVVFPGMSVPLHVFEERYRMLVSHLLTVEDPAQRVFGTVAIREGYEVGDHGAQSVYRVGCILQLTEVDRRDDGTFDIVAVARERLVLEEMQRGVDFPQGLAAVLAEPEVDVPQDLLERARATFTAFRAAMTALQDDATERLELVTRLLTEELRAINVIPSLPATQVARTAWSPN